MLGFKQCVVSKDDAEEYVEQYENYAKRFLKRYGWPQYRDELLAEAKLAIIHAVQEFDPVKGESLDKWIKYGIVHAILNERKSLRYKDHRFVPRDEPFFHNCSATDHGYPSVDEIDEVKQILSRISNEHRKILSDRFLKQMSVEQIANQYDWSIDRVSTAIRKALKSAKFRFRIKR